MGRMTRRSLGELLAISAEIFALIILEARIVLRDSVRIERERKNTFSFYDEYAYPNIGSIDMNANEVAERIIEFLTTVRALDEPRKHFVSRG